MEQEDLAEREARVDRRRLACQDIEPKDLHLRGVAYYSSVSSKGNTCKLDPAYIGKALWQVLLLPLRYIYIWTMHTNLAVHLTVVNH